MSALCVDRQSGKVLHDFVVFENEEPKFCHPTNSYASCTPVIEEGRVYVHFGSYGTACLDTATGKKIWERRDLECNEWRGPGSSPIVQGDKLIVAYDGYDYQYVVAFDKQSGKTAWRRDREIDYGTDNGDRKKAYSTATAFEHNGRTQIISPSATESIAYDPDSGDVLWRVRHGGMNAAAKPLYAHGLVYIAAGDGPLSMVAVKPDGSGDVTDTHVAWSFSKSAPKRPSPTVVGDFVAGPSHVLPTGGAGRSFAGLTVDQFQRRSSVIWYEKKALRKSLDALLTFSKAEQLDAHARSAEIRFNRRVERRRVNV
jgi:hypothetical protein